VLSDSHDEDEANTAVQPTGGDAAASFTRDLKEEERRVCLEAELHSKFNAERASRRPEMEAPYGRGWPVRPQHLRLRPLPSLAREAGSSAMPHEYHLH
jgi:hypothetical protein